MNDFVGFELMSVHLGDLGFYDWAGFGWIWADFCRFGWICPDSLRVDLKRICCIRIYVYWWSRSSGYDSDTPTADGSADFEGYIIEILKH